MTNRLRILELFCGIGGCAAAVGERAEITAAVDINVAALAVYRHNFAHPTFTREIQSLNTRDWRTWEADLWWLSPPCQPFTRRGQQRGLEDPRSAAFLTILRRIREFQPPYVALENVPPFQGSQAHAELRATLGEAGYEIAECLLCPTQLGVPNRRERFYLIAGRRPLLPWPTTRPAALNLAEILNPHPDASLEVDVALAQRYAGAMDVVSAADPRAVTN